MKNNKHKIILLFTTVILFIFKQNYANTEQTLKGYIQCDQEWKNSPKIKFLFNGKQVTSDKNGFYSIPTDQKSEKTFNVVNKYYFLVTKTIKQNADKKNTIKNLSVLPKNKYLLYSYKKDIKKEQWNLAEEKLIHKDLIIPNNCIIALVNPKYVEKVENWKIKLQEPFLALPKMILSSEISKEKAERQSNKSILKSLNYNPFHEEIKYEKKAVNEKIKLIITN